MLKSNLKALYIAKSLPVSRLVKDLPYKRVHKTKETAVFATGKAVIYIFSFGSITLMDCDSNKEKEILSAISGCGVLVKGSRITEEYEITIDSKVKGIHVDNSGVRVRKILPGMIKVIAEILAQSVALESYEFQLDSIEDKFSELNSSLEKYGKLKKSSKQIMRIIAENNRMMQEIVSGVGILEKPEAAWESGKLDNLYSRLVDEFELEERFENIQSRMDFVQENYKVFLESLRSRTEARLEWIIIILIAIEVLLFVFELVKSGVIS